MQPDEKDAQLEALNQEKAKLEEEKAASEGRLKDALQEMILAAVRQGLKKSQELEEAERAKITGKLGVPGLDGLL